MDPAMRRAAPTLPVTPAMLRHFAAVTLVATVCLAVFANGENNAATPGAKPVAEATEESGGGISAMFGGAEEAALKKAREGDGKRSVNGMNLASGTRLDQGGYNEPEEYRAQMEVQGDIRNLNPEYRNMVVGSPPPLADPRTQLAAAPAPIKRDRSGIPIPPQRAGQPGNASAGPPRAPSANDIERMMEGSKARAAAGKDPAGGNDTDREEDPEN